MTPRYRSSKYNQPRRVDDPSRYKKGSRRWSFYDGKPKEEEAPTVLQFRNVLVEEVTGGYGRPRGRFYSCDCPDYQRKETASPYQADTPDYFGRRGVPRIFPASNLKTYVSTYVRYLRGYALLSKVQFVGVEGSNRWRYRIPTDRNEKYNRDWTSSAAGIYPKWCKHIYAVAIYRGDVFPIPVDVPDENFDIPEPEL